MAMREIKVKTLSLADFKKYGTYSCLPVDNEPHIKVRDRVRFYRDLCGVNLGTEQTVSFSVCRMGSRPFVIDHMEYHNVCQEGIMPLDDDVIIFVAPATNGSLPIDEVEAFRIPKHTMVVLNSGVWHFSPYLCNEKAGHILILLPERTYVNDCVLVPLAEDQKILIQV
jgi:ureidoglycolate lyase